MLYVDEGRGTMSERWNPDEYTANYSDVVGVYLTFIPSLAQWSKLKGTNFLELGCGSGKWSATFALLGFDCVLVDNTPKMFDRVRKNFPTIAKTFICLEQDVLNLHVPPRTFDIVFSEGLYEHFLDKDDRIKFMQNVSMSLTDNGQVIIMVPCESDAEDEYKFTLEELISEWKEYYPYVDGFSFKGEDGNRINLIGIIAKHNT